MLGGIMSDKRKHVGFFSGRLSRAKFIVYFFLSFCVYTALFFALYQIPSDSALVTAIGIVVSIPYLVVLFLITVKRAHDVNLSGAWFGLILIPIAYIVFVIILMTKDGTEGPNNYGEDPLGRAATQSEGY
jgi:uncharacterized membrane protein YhaH (DUF805 family)